MKVPNWLMTIKEGDELILYFPYTGDLVNAKVLTKQDHMNGFCAKYKIKDLNFSKWLFYADYANDDANSMKWLAYEVSK